MANDLTQTIGHTTLSENHWNRITSNSMPHEIFNLDWSTYSAKDFGNTFLPKAAVIRNSSLWIHDGAEVFNGIQKIDKTFKLYNQNQTIDLITYTYPKGVLAENRKTNVLVAEYEIAVFIEVKENEEADIHFKFGNKFNEFIQNYLNDNNVTSTPASLENKIYSSNTDSIKEYFNNKLDHHNMMNFILNLLGLEYSFYEDIEKLFDLSNIKIEIPKMNTDDYCDHSFLPQFEKFANFPKVLAKNLDCEIQFYRSEEQSKGKYSKQDTGYNGSFGFDRYDKNLSGEGELSLKYFPEIQQIDKEYRAPFLALWCPKNLLPDNIKTDALFTPVSKTNIWFKITQNIKNKDLTKKSGNLFYDTNNKDILINGKKEGELYKNSSSETFTIGDTNKFSIECKGLINEHTFITFRDTDKSGKIVGVITIVPNNNIFTTNINLIDVKIGSLNSLKDNKAFHPLAAPLQTFLNTKSFNQAFIYHNVRSNYQTMTIDQKQIPDILKDSRGEQYILEAKQDDFHTQVLSIYNEQLNVKAGSVISQDFAYINNIIRKTDTETNRDIVKLKKVAQNKINKLLDVILSSLEKNKRELALQNVFTSPDVVNAIKEYNEEITKYKEEIFKKTIEELNKDRRFKDNPVLGSYTETIRTAIFSSRDLADTSKISASTLNDVYVYLYPEIDSFREYADAPGLIAGFTTPGDGYSHILNNSLASADRDELIAHELGHAYGLRHPWTQNKEIAKKDLNDKLIRLGKKPTESENQTKPNLKRLKLYYETLQKVLGKYKTDLSNFKFNTDLNKLIVEITPYAIENKIKLENLSKGTATTLEEKIIIFENQKKILEDAYSFKLSNTLDLTMGSSKENYLDYKVSRKSFWHWQWREMHCNNQPLIKTTL